MWFSYSYNNGMEIHETEELARAAAESELYNERQCAISDGEWSDDADSICWGKISEKAKSFRVDAVDPDAPESFDFALSESA